MSKLIILVGYTGIGKTTIATKHSDKALYLCGDDIHRDAARRAFPYVRKEELYSWLAWPEDPSTMHLELLLFVSLQSVCPQLREHHGHILLEGTFLANSWFREPLITAMAASGQKFAREDVHLLYWRPGHVGVYNNIQERLKRGGQRHYERTKLASVEKVETELMNYERFLNDATWERFSEGQDVDAAINHLLSPLTPQRPEDTSSQHLHAD